MLRPVPDFKSVLLLYTEISSGTNRFLIPARERYYFFFQSCFEFIFKHVSYSQINFASYTNTFFSKQIYIFNHLSEFRSAFTSELRRVGGSPRAKSGIMKQVHSTFTPLHFPAPKTERVSKGVGQS